MVQSMLYVSKSQICPYLYWQDYRSLVMNSKLYYFQSCEVLRPNCLECLTMWKIFNFVGTSKVNHLISLLGRYFNMFYAPKKKLKRKSSYPYSFVLQFSRYTSNTFKEYNRSLLFTFMTILLTHFTNISLITFGWK